MPAVNLVNIAVSIPDPAEPAAQAFLHQTQGKVVNGVPVHDGKPLPRDPTATEARHDLGPRLTYFATPTEGSVYCTKKGVMVDRKLSAADQARLIVHDWAMHSDCALPAFVLPATEDPADKALAEAVLARFLSKQPTTEEAEAFGKAFQLTGRGDQADAAYAYKQRAVDLTPRLWVPGAEGSNISAQDLLLLLAAEQAQEWEEVLSHISGLTNLVVNGGLDSSGKNLIGTSTQDTPYTYMGISATSTAPSASDTTLSGELTNASSGLKSAQITYSHTNGTGAFVGQVTFTANSYDQSNSIVPVTIAQICIRNASGGGGTMGIRELLSSTATLSASGDALTVTYTLNGSAS